MIAKGNHGKLLRQGNALLAQAGRQRAPRATASSVINFDFAQWKCEKRLGVG
jgi:hypothetical protein